MCLLCIHTVTSWASNTVHPVALTKTNYSIFSGWTSLLPVQPRDIRGAKPVTAPPNGSRGDPDLGLDYKHVALHFRNFEAFGSLHFEADTSHLSTETLKIITDLAFNWTAGDTVLEFHLQLYPIHTYPHWLGLVISS